MSTGIVDIGLKAGLFRAIADAGEGGVSEGWLSEKLGFDPRYLGVWWSGRGERGRRLR